MSSFMSIHYPFHHLGHTSTSLVLHDISNIFIPHTSSPHVTALPSCHHPINDIFPLLFSSDTHNSSSQSTSPHTYSPSSPSTSSYSPYESSPSVSSATPTPLPRRSIRQHHPPTYLNDYHYHSSHKHWCNLVSSSHIHSDYQLPIPPLSSFHEPSSYSEASKDPNWVNAIQQEIQALKANNTWELSDMPPGKKAIGNKWVYKLSKCPQ